MLLFPLQQAEPHLSLASDKRVRVIAAPNTRGVLGVLERR